MRRTARWVSMVAVAAAVALGTGCPDEQASEQPLAKPEGSKPAEEKPIPTTLPDIDDPGELIDAAEGEVDDISESLDDLAGRVKDLGPEAEQQVEPALEEVRKSVQAMNGMIEDARDASLTEAAQVRRRLDEGFEALQRRWQAALRAYEEAARPKDADR